MDDPRICPAGDIDAHVERIAAEFRAGFETVERIGWPGVAVFGSARLKEGHPAYEAAREVGRRLAEAGFAVVTGGGPGIMEAANRGAKEAGARRSASRSSCPGSRTATRTSTSSSPSTTSTCARRCS